MRPSDGRYSLWPIGVVLVCALMLVVSIQPAVRLNAKPPADFLALHAMDSKPKPAVADAYWSIALGVIQWKYNRANELPEQVPAEFRLAEGQNIPAEADAKWVRAAYWAKLREEWIRPENWHTTYSFSMAWMLQDVSSLAREIRSLFTQT